jgi:hypothetical protein
MTGLRGMIRAELARREEASSTLLPYTYTVYETADASRDVSMAIAAVEAEHAIRSRPCEPGASVSKRAPTIPPDIVASVDEALRLGIRAISLGSAG